ncbi:Chloramphenicol phosphotransferase-like protein [Serratia liquefaciens]|uniref:AAA family ATPase n=1 Tax=Serratia liquefaciens TaxID=614 RepID=UPI0021772CD2|nr:chloramphenicol phosphotransferase CPT family protein [Serratia liquefaciens]CAI1645067.1 Chloramphenicol phosphotransferase-like protein [Serratia liquefaciens]HDS8357934.1 AAA family ATPase [Serratia liquefaciens]HEJ7883969.1 AAA family ATPase [Serratia liquefaciens]
MTSTDSDGKTVILVNGVPASGKSTVARALAHHFDLPYLSLDGIKEPFMARLDNINRELNRQLGYAAYQAIWSMVAQAPLRCIYVIDAWFGFQSREQLRQYLREAGVTQVLEVWNQISGELAAERYAARTGQRPKGHPGAEYLPELRALADRAMPMAVGPVLRIEQAQPLDIDRVNHWLAQHGVGDNQEKNIAKLRVG